MIESFHAFIEKERFFGMTFFAVLSEFIVVNILVATGAVVENQPFETLNLFSVHHFSFMAFNTAHIQVFTPQGEFCFAVIETFCIFP